MCIRDSHYTTDHVLDKFNFAFVTDCTGSMSPYIENTKNTINALVRKFSSDDTGACLFSFVGYRDHDAPSGANAKGSWSDVVNACPLQQAQNTIQFINTITADGGGDGPEAVVDGLNYAVNNLTWDSSSKKYLIHILDAPPHGKEFSHGYDDYPRGCPCGIPYADVLTRMKEQDITYIVIRCNNSVDSLRQMISIYNKHYGDFNTVSLNDAKQLEFKTLEIICKDI
eukprot:TRINITY_DN3594_c0_g1_i3.p1 TRINITY_DN3594_c0_g1~~TRINITY_DN3594_c0_g1_i3.p1  ORF type:complete len:226 (-),score=28.36 TRINITY_DN3594_c0_g1_i3:5-682(-)